MAIQNNLAFALLYLGPALAVITLDVEPLIDTLKSNRLSKFGIYTEIILRGVIKHAVKTNPAGFPRLHLESLLKLYAGCLLAAR